jgi:BASS family bile acid:Na+ symporter
MGDFYVEYEYWVAVFQLMMAMFGMGATLTAGDFGDVIREPKPVTLGLLVQLLAVPTAAFLCLQGLGLEGGIAIGIALIAAIPGGTTSNIFTFFARGNSALSIAITALTTLACLVTTPAILSLLISDSLPAGFSMPVAQIVTEIGLILLLPLGLGMLCLHLYPAPAAVISKWCIRASLFGILLIVVGSLSAGRLDLTAFGTENVLRVIVFTLVLFVTGWLTPRLFRLSRKDAVAIEFEVVVRNTNLAVMLKASMFPAAAGATAQLGDAILFTVLLYGGLQLLIAPILIRIYSQAAIAAQERDES